MESINEYLNPLARLGKNKYSSRLPLLSTAAVILVIEFFLYVVIGNPNMTNASIIFVFMFLVIYFSFRDGVLGGSIVTLLSTIYYAYIIYSRGYEGEQLINAENTIVILSVVYLFIAGIVGWLKQKTDKLILQGREGERRLKTIVEQLPVGIVIRNKSGEMEMTNKHANKIINIKSTETKSLIEKIMNNQALVLNHEYSIRRKDKGTTYIQASAVTIQNDDNEIIGSAAIINDVTRLKEIEQRKDDFINMASHELKTPITSMRLYLDLLSAEVEKMDPEKRQIINSIRLQTKRLQKLAGDLVDVSRIQTGKFSLEKTRFALDKLMEETIGELAGASINRQILFTKRRQIIVMADQFRIYQVFTNIITNSLKYSPGDTPVVVTLRRIDNDAVVSVSDKGPGIDKDKQKKIFEKLYQVNTGNQYTFPGLGMGLYISKEIIKRHNGKIWVKSEKGHGSTFYFSLPIN